MRTTVDIPDGMYRRLKSKAAREGSSTRALILRGVKEILKTARRKVGAPCHCRFSGPSARALWPSRMPPSTTSLFPDINVWVALTYEGHVHHAIAAEWFRTLPPDATLVFCRFTQIGLLRC